MNLHLTAHPATLAIGLIYMQTNDVRMARHVELPNTIKELEQIRPDVASFFSSLKSCPFEK